MIPVRIGLLRELLLLSMVLSACGGGSGDPAAVVPTPPPVSPVPPVALEDALTNHAFLTDHFSGSENCSFCHDGLQDASGADVSIVTDWQSTIMANSARDPFWRAKVASEVRRNPALAEEIELTCGRCHVPMANTEAQFANTSAALFDDGLLHPDNPLFDAANEGVSCTLCHQIDDSAALGKEAGFSGNFEIPYSFGIDRLAYGQYTNPQAPPMQNFAAFTPSASEHVSSSELCATCHNLSTTVIDSQGNPTEQMFPEQMVYTEWENSQFADDRSCQDCHMLRADGDVAISTRPMNGLTARPDFARHAIVGGNTYMLDILSQNREQLNISATGFENTIEQTRELLVSSVTLTLEDLTRVGDDAVFTVRLANNSGHKFPTGYPSRRAWLHVQVIDAAGATVFESGAIDSSGRIAGLDSDTSPAFFEPHYEFISSGDQVQSYETIMQDLDGNLTYTLVEAATYRKDNRLLPAGMDKTTVPATIEPHGNAATDADFVGGSDLVRYQVVGLPAGRYSIIVNLDYQSLAYGFAQDLFRDAADPRVALFRDLDDAARRRFETVASVSDSIEF